MLEEGGFSLEYFFFKEIDIYIHNNMSICKFNQGEQLSLKLNNL